jgi:hypothetical protein
MNIRLSSQMTASFLLIGLAFSAAIAQPAFADSLQAPPVPTDVQVEAGNTAFLVGHASGTQNYVCLPSATGFAWTFFSPQATLFQNIKWFGGDLKQQIITHFLSPNPIEDGTARATWQNSFDTSTVWAKTIGTSRDPNFVKEGAIPWLLLKVVGAKRGPTEGVILTPTSFIQRLNTAGGSAPSTGCSEAANVGSTSLVPYTADYFFYKSSK